MRTLSHLTMASALAAFGVSPVIGQSAPLKVEQQKQAEAERKLAEERARAARELQEKAEAERRIAVERQLAAEAQLEKLQQEKRAEAERKIAEDRVRYAREVQAGHDKMKDELEARARQLQAVRDQLAEELKRKTEGPKPIQPPVALPQVGVRRVETAPALASDAAAALRPLTKSDDPKVASLASALLEQLTKKAPPAVGTPVTARLTFSSDTPKLSESVKVVLFDDGGKPGVKVAEGSSSLRMSADGKSAALVAADGTVTVFDTASGKEMMKFPAKK